MDADDYDYFVGRIYEVALTPNLLPEILTELTTLIDGDTCHLVGWNGRDGPPFLSTTVGLDKGIGPDYAAHYAALDPRQRVTREELKIGEILLCHEHLDSGFVSRSEFYQDYLLPIGLHYTLASTLIQNDARLIQIAFHRYVGHKPFSGREHEFMARLMPHLQRALRLTLMSEELRRHSALSGGATAAVSLALFAIRKDGRLISCNA